MIAFFLAFVCFLITIPLKAIIMGYELNQKHKKSQGKSVYEKIVPTKVSNVIDRLGIHKTSKDDDSSTENDTKDSLKKPVELVKQTVVIGLKLLVGFLKAFSVILTTCGFLGVLIILIVLCVVIASVAGILSVLNQDDINAIEEKHKNDVAQESSVDNTDVTGLHGAGPTQMFADNSSWVNCCKTVFDWYYNNIHTYCKQHPGEKGYPTTANGRGYYPCELFHGQKVGDDCSSYVSNCLVYAGFLPEKSVNCFVSGSFWGSGKNQLANYFNFYTYEDYKNGTYIPRAGDIMAFDGHVEILAQVTPGTPHIVYSWGRVPDFNPHQTTRGGNTLEKYIHATKCIWSLKDNVLPNSYIQQNTGTSPATTNNTTNNTNNTTNNTNNTTNNSTNNTTNQ